MPFLGDWTPNLTLLCIPASAVPLTGEFPALRTVTTFRVMFGLLYQARVVRILTLCPNLKRLFRADSLSQPASLIHHYPVALDTLSFSHMRAPVPAFFAAPMLEMLNAPSVRHIMLGSHMDAMTLLVVPLHAIVRAKFEFREGYIELVDER